VESALTEVFARFGQAALHAQDLEANLINLLLIQRQLDPEPVDSAGLRNLEALWSRRALGTLLKEVRERGELSEFKVQELEVARDRRNYLVHRFFYENAEALMVDDALPHLVAELTEIAWLLKHASATVTGLYLRLLEGAGLDRSEFEQMRDRALADMLALAESSWQRG
jgi:hypothetical protein